MSGNSAVTRVPRPTLLSIRSVPPCEPHPLDYADEPEAPLAGGIKVESRAALLDLEPQVAIDLPQ